jgi:1,4-dihydroxy-2-naphthoate octaprenyltransferase
MTKAIQTRIELSLINDILNDYMDKHDLDDKVNKLLVKASNLIYDAEMAVKSAVDI